MAGMKRILAPLFLAAAAVLAAGSVQPARFDVLIRNARVLDGSGNPWIRADVGISGDRIAAVGRLDAATAARVIDAGDRVLAPGFIDVHSHALDGLVLPDLHQGQALIAQGVTTLVGNPDGGGPVDLAAQRAAIEAARPGPNVALLIGHGSVRRAVLAEARRDPTVDELEKMKELVRRAMKEGAFGLSSGLFYVPGLIREDRRSHRAREDRGRVRRALHQPRSRRRQLRRRRPCLGAGGHPHRRSSEHRRHRQPHEGAREGQLGPRPHLDQGPDDARARGVQVYADQYPYEASSTGLRAALAPGGAEPTEAVVAENLRRRNGPDAILIAHYAADPSLAGKTLTEIAKLKGVTPVRAAIALIAAGNAQIVSFNMSEPDIEAIMKAPFTMASSDGGLPRPGVGHPHPRDYGAFARRLAVYVRDRKVVPLEFAIRSMTSLPASVFGMTDRGVIRPGAFADLVIFDPAAIRDMATYAEPQKLAVGVSHVFVNGVAVLDDATFTDAAPGRVLRKQ